MEKVKKKKLRKSNLFVAMMDLWTSCYLVFGNITDIDDRTVNIKTVKPLFVCFVLNAARDNITPNITPNEALVKTHERSQNTEEEEEKKEEEEKEETKQKERKRKQRDR